MDSSSSTYHQKHGHVFTEHSIEYQTSLQSSLESPPSGALNTGGVYKFCDFRPISHYNSKMRQDSAIVTIEGK